LSKLKNPVIDPADDKIAPSRPGAAASFARRIHASLETENTIFSARGLGVSLAQAQGPAPRVANMLVEDYLRPAAVKVGILSSHRDDKGRLVDDDPRRFGFHNLRHSLASFLVRMRTNPKTVQTLLRHSDVKLTLQCYTHSVSEDRMAAAGAMLTAIFSHGADKSGLKAD
jgi:integrase